MKSIWQENKNKSILFVCLGNICRSPLAEGIAKDIILKNSLDIKVDSAGTGDWHINETPCSNSQKVAKFHGIDISHLRARQVTKDDFEKFNLIVALDDNNFNDLRSLGAVNLVKLGYFGLDNQDIPDPYFFDGFDGFEHVYDMIQKAISNLLDNL